MAHALTFTSATRDVNWEEDWEVGKFVGSDASSVWLFARAPYNFVVALETAGENARARQEYEAYLQLSPTSPDAGEIRIHLRELHSSKK